MEGLDSPAAQRPLSEFVKVNRRWTLEQRLLVAFLMTLAAVGLAGMVVTFMA